MKIVVREFDRDRDSEEVEELERKCEVGPASKVSIFTHLLGDPLCRIRHSPAFLMLVAEIVDEEEEEGKKRGEIVGMIRGCIKAVTCGKKYTRPSKLQLNDNDSVKTLPIYTKAAYILGLRISSSHRRMGIALKLVHKMEDWFRQNGAEYSYLATEKDNQASVKLFNHKCGYSKFRTPSILVQPVFAHRVKLSNQITILKLTPTEAEAIYRAKFSTTEFFPRDIDTILNNKLTLGTFIAMPHGPHAKGIWRGVDEFLANPPESWAILSVWNSNNVWRLEVRGASRVGKVLAKTTRLMDRAFPLLKIPSFPDVFRPFGLHFLYGLGGEGPNAAKMVKTLCGLAHNLAQEHGCSVVAMEVANREPLKVGVPHWKKLSCDEDLWLIKRLGEDYSDGSLGDWTKSSPGVSIFVDPREF
ncbi:hypothetical protein RND81_13G190600 [Saponaria officinalis]|uniref:N-acetyltransferase domain-containing protein n=1 Tax=Saponaria officinalis TaxID=3572 RepID=A0AAW1H572_SAPOF